MVSGLPDKLKTRQCALGGMCVLIHVPSGRGRQLGVRLRGLEERQAGVCCDSAVGLWLQKGELKEWSMGWGLGGPSYETLSLGHCISLQAHTQPYECLNQAVLAVPGPVMCTSEGFPESGGSR